MIRRASHVDDSVLDATSLVGATIRRKAKDNNRVGGLQMHPVLGWETEEGEQGVCVFGDLLDRLRPLDLVLGLEPLDCRYGMLTVFCVTDFCKRSSCRWLS